MQLIKGALSTNGLLMPADFPVIHYESVHKHVQPQSQTENDRYEQFAGAWNAVAYRFVATGEYEAALTAAFSDVRGAVTPEKRSWQERDLFGFFSNGVSVFESAFYGLFSIGALLAAAEFPLSTPSDQQRVSPTTTSSALKKAFPGDPILEVVSAVTSDTAYREAREIRNVLTHRTAPGRTFFASVGGDDDLPDQWKLNNITLDATMASTRRAEVARLLTELLKGIDRFVQARLGSVGEN
jgi:hypothetical protein